MSGTGPTPAVTVDQFRRDFPEFADSLKFQASTIQLYLNLAAWASPRRWGQFYAIGQELYAAHFLVLDATDVQAATRGVLPGQQTGPAVSKSVGGVSVTFAEYATLEGGAQSNAGQWNLTVYGKRYLRMAKMAGMGPVQITNPPGYYPYGNTALPYENIDDSN